MRMITADCGIAEARAGGVGVEQMHEFLLELPEVEQGFLGEVERAEGDDAAQKGQVGFGIGGALQGGQLETSLQTGQIDGGAVQRFGQIAERVHGGRKAERRKSESGKRILLRVRLRRTVIEHRAFKAES